MPRYLVGLYSLNQDSIVLQVLDRQFKRFCETIARPELADDPRFNTGDGRVANAKELTSIVADWIMAFPSDDAAVAHLQAARCPAAKVLDPADAITHPYFVERQMVRQVDDPILGRVAVPGMPVKFSDRPEPDDEPQAPFLGQHNEEVLTEVLGMGSDEIADLTASGILATEPVPVES